VQPGQTIGHYRIVRLLGQGGMGAVYLAEDTKLHRQVALKTLPPEMAASPDRLERFQREAQAVAALNHPHIVTIHSVEEEGGAHFLTMELVEGESLDHSIPGGGLSLAKVFDIGIALADALAAAHEKGIVHRDLKPANVMLTKDGRVKVLDFGLAKLDVGTFGGGPAGHSADVSSAPTEAAPPGESLTGAGMVMGTVPYMSPEQVGGEIVDARTDIFSLGVVLYEMATGRRPFGGKNNAETISSILRDAPRPVTEARQEAPRHLGRIIDHCLQKAPGDRFQTVRDVYNELRALRREIESGASHAVGTIPAASTPAASGAQPGSAGWRLWLGAAGAVVVIVALVLIVARGRKTTPTISLDGAASGTATSATPAPDEKSIAVLPFVNMSSDPEQEYFSDGISEELLNLLAKIPQLLVTSRSSAFSFKGQKLEIREIARRLNVAHVLEGSVRKSGKHVRITAQLIKADSDTHLWSQTWDRTLDDIFAIQDEIASDVVKQLQVTLLGTAPAVRKTDPAAYALFLQAVQLSRLFNAEGLERSDALYRKVLEIDPRYAPAWDGLARNSWTKIVLGLLSNEEALRRSGEEAGKALAIDPMYAPAHTRLGIIAMYRGDLAGAVRHFERALELDPADLSVVANAANLLTSLGRLNESLRIREFVVARDPVNVGNHSNLALSYFSVGRLDEAIASERMSLTLSPGRVGAHSQIGLSLLQKGEPEAALEEIQQETDEAYRRIGRSMAYHALGRKAESDAALAELIEKDEKDCAYNIAYVLAFRGEADRAFEWLHKAVAYDDPGFADIPQAMWLFANIQKDPRWLPFLRSIGKAPEQLAAIKFNVKLPEQ
jgi:serine/threonine protein kinase/tetratricopeptide (TPR) repeat protein